jgi:hypothetical protein
VLTRLRSIRFDVRLGLRGGGLRGNDLALRGSRRALLTRLDGGEHGTGEEPHTEERVEL